MDDPEMAPDPAGVKRGVRVRWPALLIAGAGVLFFWQYLLFDQTLFAGDTAFVYLPFRKYVLDELARGKLALWNPCLFGGSPALAVSQHQVFYLPNLLLFLLGVPRGMGWMLPLHLALMGAGLYRFCRRSLGMSRPAAALSAVAFPFCGFIQSHHSISVYVEAAAWMPWVLLGYDHGRRRGGPALALPGLALAMQLFTGGPQIAYLALALLFAYHLYCLHSERGHGAAGRAWLALLLTLVVGGAAAAPQALPEFELSRHADRGTQASYAYATEFSLVPRHLLAILLFPKFWGLYSSLPADGYSVEEVGYPGILCLGLVAAAIAGRRSRRGVLFWALAGTAAVLLALGGHNPIYPLLHHWVPGIAIFRAPARWLLVASFACAVLAGMGLDALLGDRALARRAARAAFAATAVLLAAGVGVLISPGGAGAVGVPQSPYGPWGQIAVIAAATVFFAAVWRGCASPAGKVGQWAPAAAIALLLFDLFALSLDMETQHTLTASSLGEAPASVQQVRRGDPPERFWPGHAMVSLERWQKPAAAEGLAAGEFRARGGSLARSLMLSSIPCAFGTHGLTGAWGGLMPLRRHARPIYNAKSPLEVQRRWLRLLNVRTYLSVDPLPDPQLELADFGVPSVYQDPKALPRAFFVERARRATGEEAVAAIGSPGFDPRREVLLESGAAGTPQGSAGSRFVPAQFTGYGPQRVVMQVDAPAPGYLVLMDTPYPGWRASLDGRPAEILPANWVGRAVAVTAGSHTVEMRFAPTSLRFGLFWSLAALATLAGWFGFAAVRRQR